MPTFNQRDSDGGYYILARPPETGIITYQVGSGADPIVESYGLRPEDEISWDVIQTLKLLGQISTEGSGTLEVDDFKPDPDQLQETALSEEQARELLATIQEHRELTQEELETICLILGIKVPRLDTDRLQDALKNTVSSLVSSGNLPVSNTLEYTNHSEIEVSASTWNIEDQEEDGEIGLRILLISFSGKDSDSDKLNLLSHCICVSQERGITKWIVGFSDEKSWRIKSEITQQMAHLLPIVVDELERSDICPGDPKDLQGPIWREFGNTPC